MARVTNRRSQVVTRLKWALPAIALIALSTLILFSNPRPAELAIGLTDATLVALAGKGGIGNARVTTKTRDGKEVELTAREVAPRADDKGIFDARDVSARIAAESAEIVDASARAGVLDTSEQEIRLSGNVVLVSSTGYRAETENLSIALDETRAISETPVVITGTLGRLEAGRMEIREKRPGLGKNVMIFTEGVKVLYLPQQTDEDTQ